MKYFALIPAYKPEKILPELVCGLVEAGFSVLVVDDGSGSEFASVFEEVKKSAEVLSYTGNRGKGYALKKGLKYIYENEGEAVIVTMDADGQHLVCDACTLCREVLKKDADLYIGSRRISGKDPIKSRLGNGITRLVYQSVTGVKVHDTQSGLRAFTSNLIPLLLEIEGDRYEYEMNVLLTLARKKKLMREIPISTIYFDSSNSVSHFKALRDSLLIYREIFKFAQSSLVCFFIDYSFYSLILLAFGSGSVLFANVIARVISSGVNFSVNKKLVFQSENSIFSEAAKYFGLALLILGINSCLLSLLTAGGMNAYLSKLFVECFMFFVSYGIQSCFIFKRGVKHAET